MEVMLPFILSTISFISIMQSTKDKTRSNCFVTPFSPMLSTLGGLDLVFKPKLPTLHQREVGLNQQPNIRVGSG